MIYPWMSGRMAEAAEQAIRAEERLIAVLAITAPHARDSVMAEVERRTAVFTSAQAASPHKRKTSPREQALNSVYDDVTHGRIGG